MKATISFKNGEVTVDLSRPLDISIPLRGNKENVNAWYLSHPRIEAVTDGDFTGSVRAGASTNFNNIFFNPHAHGTHTECIGHITEEFHSVSDSLRHFLYLAELVSIAPQKEKADMVIKKAQLENALKGKTPEAVVIRTYPNNDLKLSAQYSHTNPPYLEEEAAVFLRELGVKHLLVDLPSVDREVDGGKLLAHKAFWDYDGDRRLNATITEFIYVKDEIDDGTYLLDLMTVNFVNDAAPSRPVLYKTE